MTNKIALVLPYYGRFPNYFQLFLRSVEMNPGFDVLLVTDIDTAGVSLPANVHVVALSLGDIRNRVKSLIPAPLKLDEAYKLCDCKPLYGVLFEKELNGYQFWGHCDADMLFGDLSFFVNDEILDSHDKLFTHGHFVLYRNEPRVNGLGIEYHDAPCGLDFAASSKLCCYFDEVGIANIAKLAGLRVYENPAFADITPVTDTLTLAPICSDANMPGQRFFWRDGHVVRTAEGLSEPTEFMYIHLQKRRMEVHVDGDEPAWEICRHGFYAEGAAPAKEPRAFLNRIEQEGGFQLSRLRRLSPERVRLSSAIKAMRLSL